MRIKGYLALCLCGDRNLTTRERLHVAVGRTYKILISTIRGREGQSFSVRVDLSDRLVVRRVCPQLTGWTRLNGTQPPSWDSIGLELAVRERSIRDY